jgi:protein-L-isoaspartate(D-aspartate) O-methyltransferase
MLVRRGRAAPYEASMRFSESNDELVDAVGYRAEFYLGGGVRDSRVLAAMRELDRASFLPPGLRGAAYLDEPVSIGLGQTCSQPSMVAFMLDKLRLGPGLRVLEVGAGSGYAAAIAALLCAPGGLVVAAEILPELAAMARANCAAALGGSAVAAASAAEVDVVRTDASAGLPERGPFDRIFLSAGASRPSFREDALLPGLSEGGVLLYPESQGRLYRITRSSRGLTRESWEGVAFVRLRGRNS